MGRVHVSEKKRGGPVRGGRRERRDELALVGYFAAAVVVGTTIVSLST